MVALTLKFLRDDGGAAAAAGGSATSTPGAGEPDLRVAANFVRPPPEVEAQLKGLLPKKAGAGANKSQARRARDDMALPARP